MKIIKNNKVAIFKLVMKRTLRHPSIKTKTNNLKVQGAAEYCFNNVIKYQFKNCDTIKITLKL